MRFKVDGMSCEHCVRAVTQAVQDAAPGSAPTVDLPSGTVSLAGDADPDAVMAAIQGEGYDVQRLPG